MDNAPAPGFTCLCFLWLSLTMRRSGDIDTCFSNQNHSASSLYPNSTLRILQCALKLRQCAKRSWVHVQEQPMVRPPRPSPHHHKARNSKPTSRFPPSRKRSALLEKPRYRSGRQWLVGNFDILFSSVCFGQIAAKPTGSPCKTDQ